MDITSSIYLAVAFIVLLFYLRLILFSRNIANQESSTSVLRCVDRPRANQDQHQLATHVQRTNQPASAALCMKYSSCFFCVSSPVFILMLTARQYSFDHTMELEPRLDTAQTKQNLNSKAQYSNSLPQPWILT
ncbi:hypothetical protein HRR90_005694 [Exophiala dermatitidis]|nr:hypothetical protein HRR74_004178 [Exophiala dermatitidis]KAJ4529251.1 hypothetical protein HRR73_000273 [Exophiala dermatitidis]KAJ4544098.1 hypothetical protein HRR76_002168 [Exophiala dermatitidis]KAJ4582628.1 hypothetical protein HRR81_001356 [Exophiala dermatitidis]KAJ4619959.1 hypothetical protein HRR86_006670 [Exophiala dermatitidis]